MRAEPSRQIAVILIMSLMALSACTMRAASPGGEELSPETLASSMDWHLSIINSNASNRTKASAAWNLSLAYTRSVSPPDLEKAYKYARMHADLKGERGMSVQDRERLMLLGRIAELRSTLADTNQQLLKSGRMKEELELQKRNLNEAIEKLEELQMEHEIKRRSIK